MNTGIITVTLNAAIDKTYYMNHFESGSVMRVDRVHAIAGGKGLNVARVLQQLGHKDVTATGFKAGYNGQFIAKAAEDEGIHTEFVDIKGESRVCLSIVDEENHSFTEVLEPGPLVTIDDEARMKEHMKELAQRASLVIISGSMPKGCRLELYKELIEICTLQGVDVFLDASGNGLVEGMRGKPALIKPNEDEIKPWLKPDGNGKDAFGMENGISLRSYGRAIQNIAKDTGIPRIIVSLGAKGALACMDGVLYRIRIPELKAVNPVGSGDSFVAGFAYAHVRQMPVEQCLRYAAAAGSANALKPTAGCVEPEDHMRLMEQIEVEKWID
ncbi:1-phosphofructokinase family hexose kinase [Paenibacillus dakarensis]|uniref:1-phosphofructokinase family hexose kinase n=1 Tax=Paenibacillus dakarensis TaxID=1527293 RepID=UPI0006D53DCE|nr:1-phosphofructokinase family hexose kinase [Paenibacillus dakarensis]